MGDDLVNQLRSLINDDDTEMLAWDAANRIEKLEAALLHIANLEADPEFGTPPLETAKAIAQKVL
jgi:hypothetical protein